MKANEQAKMLREMAAGYLAAAANAESYSLPTWRKQDVDHYQAKAAALNAGAEALEAMSAKQTSAAAPTAQKAEILLSLADTADALAKLDCGLTDRAGMEQSAAQIRECADLMREKTDPEWVASYERRYKGRLMSVVETRNGNWFWYVDAFNAFDPFDAQLANGREAAKAAAVAWVDEQEGRDA
jgi:hypothetical protein